ncbi:DUF4350 domain-containing protein [Catenovulum sp. 2E275]|uniref:DUF4350 domain-containing protein n=1 Tax=Catenovulum sp. 2E275 TaxID=2980497 RepID=UPI0021D21FB2|nr:DUF4350 domain-containing protein [Catenovulum sp. 2E275]MCU4675273.1 DUF4350 domain-containing protein [Catenovulum sp. 2E275]
MEWRKLLRWCLISVLVGLVSTCCYQNFELKENQIRLNLPNTVMQNPFLALNKLAEQYQQNFKVYQEYDLLFTEQKGNVQPKADSVLILARSDTHLSKLQAEKIINWVKSGGHLILAMDAAFYKQVRDIQHPLWQQLNISAHSPLELDEPEDDNSTEEQAEVELDAEQDESAQTEEDPEETAEKNKFDNEFSTEILTDTGAVFYTFLEKSYRIAVPESLELMTFFGDQQGATFVQFGLEKGIVSLLTEVDIWNNRQLDQAHNAYFYHWLTNDKTDVTLFSAQMENHWLINLFIWSPGFIFLSILLVILFVWRQAVRFGSIITTDEAQKHFFHQHIEAAGEYYWKHNQQLLLIGSLQQEIFEVLNKRWPGFTLAEQNEQLVYLNELTELDNQLILQALYQKNHQHEQSFTKQIRILQKLRTLI